LENCWASLRQPEPPRSLGEAFELLPLAKKLSIDEAEDGEPPFLPADRAQGFGHRSFDASNPDVLAWRTRTA